MSKRRQTKCPGTRVSCPTCHHLVVHRVDVRSGDGFALCDHKVGRPGERRVCGQHLYWVCTAGLCTVIAIAAEERRGFADDHHEPEEVLRQLGVGEAEISQILRKRVA